MSTLLSLSLSTLQSRFWCVGHLKWLDVVGDSWRSWSEGTRDRRPPQLGYPPGPSFVPGSRHLRPRPSVTRHTHSGAVWPRKFRDHIHGCRVFSRLPCAVPVGRVCRSTNCKWLCGERLLVPRTVRRRGHWCREWPTSLGGRELESEAPVPLNYWKDSNWVEKIQQEEGREWSI